jgi:hypothetical protein
MTIKLHHGDCLDILRTLPDASVDAVVTDPPYGLEFMGKQWDAPWKFSCIAIEREADYLPLIQQRIDRRRDPVAAVKAQGDDGGLFDLLDGGAA